MVESDLRFYRREVANEEIARIFNTDYKRVVSRILGELKLLQADDTLDFFDKPRGHEGSQALYLLEEMVGKDMILVSYLGPNGKTTLHKHQEPIKEKYFQLAGSSHLRLDEDFHELRKGSFLTVPSNVPHQLTTKDNSSLVLIVMENAISVPRDKLHIPVGQAQNLSLFRMI